MPAQQKLMKESQARGAIGKYSSKCFLLFSSYFSEFVHKLLPIKKYYAQPKGEKKNSYLRKSPTPPPPPQK